MTGERDSESVEALRVAMRAMLATPTGEYRDVRRSAERATLVLREEIATAVQETINAHMSRLASATYSNKKVMAADVTEELRNLGLAIRCPRTGRACSLQAHPGRDHDVGRFRLEYADESGQRHHPMTSVELPALTVMPLPVVTAKNAHGTKRGR